ncbi:MAG: DUF2891 domain-containing protein [Armatimonadetes bacterium]|nr:DUF2891 domain-containing protein [Armatimonadota bacterium]
MLSPDLARRFSNSTLGHVGRKYPYHMSHLFYGPESLTPSERHPIFYGSFDWHSCVHGWWQLFRIARLQPALSHEIYDRAVTVFTADAVRGEVEYLTKNPSFERPYGWGWLLALHQEMWLQTTDGASTLEPLARLIADLLKDYLPRLTYPIRAGTHANTAFALIHARRWFHAFDSDGHELVVDWAKSRFGNDSAAPWLEPSGEDFLSPTLAEAVLMAEILPPGEFVKWFEHFLPNLPDNLLAPVDVSDRTDGRIGHLDGLNLSRAWSWRILGLHMPAIRELTDKAFLSQMDAALPHLEANYMSEHWLCSFALLALTDSGKA